MMLMVCLALTWARRRWGTTARVRRMGASTTAWTVTMTARVKPVQRMEVAIARH